ncbi:hypothetical protein D3C71_1643420 [compost metagenome]
MRHALQNSTQVYALYPVNVNAKWTASFLGWAQRNMVRQAVKLPTSFFERVTAHNYVNDLKCIATFFIEVNRFCGRVDFYYRMAFKVFLGQA